MKKYFTIFITLFIAGLFISLFFNLGFFVSWRNKLTDKLFIQSNPNSDIVIVAIDNESLQKLGRWPWDRTIHAQLIDKINKYNPIVIGLDVNFPEKSSSEADTKLAQAINNAGNVVLPIEAELQIKKNQITAISTLSPIKEIKDAAIVLGITNTPPDQDSIFRKLPTTAYYYNEKYSAFSVVIANAYLKKNQFFLPSILTDKKGRMTINYVGKPKTFPMISAKDVMEGKVTSSLFKNKIVLIGATAPDLHDEQITPVSSGQPMSGVEIHANAINTILTGNFLKPLNIYIQNIILLFLALIIGFIVMRFKILVGFGLTLTILILYLITAFMSFEKGIIFDLFYVILIIILTYLTAIIWKYIIENKERQRIKDTFSHYVSPEIIKEILADPAKLKLGGQKKELSILFSDIRNFTFISERLEPEKLVLLLNQYLTAMTDLIMESNGVVDKYIGDAIMAFWGAPIKQHNHAEFACKTALQMISILDKKREEWQKKFDVDLRIGIGINTGEVIIGNMGSDKRFDYTIMGDSVNLASRLEGITKQYGVPIVVSEFTKAQVTDKFTFRYLDKVTVKGKTQGVKIYELTGKTS
ncbi:adenylate/guanylate cyclase domain-containing protein [Patescibacteria group bacterium]|nr:adenylate/guanylate cyclase domain-containing protein [Patescibacteria group bacterium]MBU1349844.1 adenylate/guanylate cyclase domain-containing protein [Patescibacteria group bacterium]MBU1987237.1 adenylate/guanylate cyclase domain-containing protein [Patescibacteria group bacterium]MBU2474759.1 adenylate/guanylate cyclase domain-containing protein [Patescibacteria group bacterium]